MATTISDNSLQHQWVKVESSNTNLTKQSFMLILAPKYQKNIKCKYSLSKELGRGHNGITYLCTTKKIPHQVFACKTISKKNLTIDEMEDLRSEVAIMQCLPQHPNIIALKDVFEDHGEVYLVMELCEGSELFDQIFKRDHYPEKEAASLIRIIVEVIQTCHAYGIMHRDLKPENILFVNKGCEKSQLKVIDFGNSVFFKLGEKFCDVIGSPSYVAPKVLRMNYGPEADIWSVRVILYTMLCGSFLFGENPNQILYKTLEFEDDPWPMVSESAKELVRLMLDRNPKTQYTTKQVLSHPWLQKI